MSRITTISEIQVYIYITDICLNSLLQPAYYIFSSSSAQIHSDEYINSTVQSLSGKRNEVMF